MHRKTKQSKAPAFGFGVAACSARLNAGGEIQLTPAGNFRGIDGRPADAEHWVMDAQAAQDVIAFCSARANPFVIDYEHQTLLKEKNGQPAPAAGWFTGADLVYREGEGLFAKAQLTARAQEYVAAGEYKFISPVILYKKGSGRIVGLHSAALTNTACIDGMDDLLSLAAASFALDGASVETSQESLSMNIEELLEQLRWLLNLPTLATAEEISAELQKAVAQIKESNAAETAAASFSITGLVSGLNAQVAELSAATPDPAKFVSVDAMAALQTQVAALTAEKVEREVNGVVAAALTAGKLLPPQEKWARELGRTNMAALTAYLDTAQPVAALSGTQTGGAAPAGKPEGALNEAELAMCSALGVSAEDFKKTKAAA